MPFLLAQSRKAYCKHGKSALLLLYKKKFLKIHANLKGHNRVYILSSKYSYRPMRVRVVAQLFYKVHSTLPKSVKSRFFPGCFRLGCLLPGGCLIESTPGVAEVPFL